MRRLSDETIALILVLCVGLLFLGGCEVVKDEQARNNAEAEKIWSVRR
jgi:hypothetical protein